MPSSNPSISLCTASLFKGFVRDAAGNFGILTAIVLPVLCGAAGAALDISNAMQVKSDLGAISDSASLAAASALASKKITTATQAKAFAQQFASAQLESVGVDASDFTVEVDVRTTVLNTLSNKYEISVAVNGAIDTTLMRLLGKNKMEVSNAATAKATTGTQNSLSMYLVLDASGSMQASVTTSVQSYSRCTYYYLNAAQTSMYSQKNVYPCYNQRIEVLKSSVNGLLATLAKADPDRKYIRTGADAYSTGKFEPTGLDWGSAGVAKYVGEMEPLGGTNSTEAFKEAVDSLLDPMEDSVHKNKNGLLPKKYVVFMTDGENNSPSDNAKTIAQCKRAKDAGATVYTVGFMLASASAKSFLLNCASNASTYYDAQDAGFLTSAFATIATQTAGGLPLLTK